MAVSLHALQRRLAKFEQRLVNLPQGEDLAGCICQKISVALCKEPEEFEAEMNRRCPVHGLRDLGVIVMIGNTVDEEQSTAEMDELRRENANLERLVDLYEARRLPTKAPRTQLLAQLRYVARRLKHDSQEP